MGQVRKPTKRQLAKDCGAGLSRVQIAAKYQIPISRIGYYLKVYGLRTHGKPIPHNPRWTPQDISILKKLVLTSSIDEAVKILGKTRVSIYKKTRRLGLKFSHVLFNGRKVKVADKKFVISKSELKKDYELGMPLEDMATKYGVCQETIRHRFLEWGIKPNRANLCRLIEKQDLLDAIDRGLTQRQVGKKYGVARSVIYRACIRLGIEWPNNLFKISKEQLEADYDAGMFQHEIAKKYNVAPITVSVKTKEFGIAPLPAVKSERYRVALRQRSVEMWSNEQLRSEASKKSKRNWELPEYKDAWLKAAGRSEFRSEIEFKLARRLRGRVSSQIRRIAKGKCKAGSAVSDLGCSLKFLKEYLEKQFRPGMTWENHGLYGWHIDHVEPLVNFDLTDREQFLQACHYTNLQPLWAKDNMSKWIRHVEK